MTEKSFACGTRRSERAQQRDLGCVVEYHGRGNQDDRHGEESLSCLDVAQEPLANKFHHPGRAGPRQPRTGPRRSAFPSWRSLRRRPPDAFSDAARTTTAPTRSASVLILEPGRTKTPARIASVAYISKVSPDPDPTRPSPGAGTRQQGRGRLVWPVMASPARFQPAWSRTRHERTFRRRDERSTRADGCGPWTSPACLGRASANYCNRTVKMGARTAEMGALKSSIASGLYAGSPRTVATGRSHSLPGASAGLVQFGSQRGRCSDQRFLDIMGHLEAQCLQMGCISMFSGRMSPKISLMFSSRPTCTRRLSSSVPTPSP